MKYSIYYSQLGGSNIIDLTNIVPEIKLIEEPNGLQIRTNVKIEIYLVPCLKI